MAKRHPPISEEVFNKTLDECVIKEQERIALAGSKKNFRLELEDLEGSGFKLEPPSEEFAQATVEAAREVFKEDEDDVIWNMFWSKVRSFFNWIHSVFRR